ncbi:MAG: phosphate-binding protein [Chlorobi bacterium]|nr:phosphate-binding protein [Chlorobiota bacterium]
MPASKKNMVSLKGCFGNSSGRGGAAVLAGFFRAFLMLLLVSGCEAYSARETGLQSPTSGHLRVAADASLVKAAEEQAGIFTAHYPDASISVVSELPGKTLLSMLKKRAGAVLINGSLTPEEASLLELPEFRGRKEPVARDALVCLVNRNCPVDSITIGTLGAIFSGSRQEGAELVPWISRSDYRLLATVSELLGTGIRRIHAREAGSDSLLAVRTASDTRALGLLYLSAYKTLSLPDGIHKQIRMLPVASGQPGSTARMPSEQHLFSAAYPLTTTVSFIYVPGNPLATGFGSWLSKEGQKAFERSYLAPVRQLPRNIILK